MNVLYSVLPIILNAAVGFYAARRSIFEKPFLHAFSRLTFRFFIPCLLFASMVRADLGGLGQVRLFWLTYFVPAIVIFLAVRVLASPTMALTVTYSNSVLIGIPLVLRTFGDDGLSATLTIISVNGLTLFTMMALTGGGANDPGAVGSQARAVQPLPTRLLTPIFATLQNPIIIALILGAAANFLHIPIFEPLLDAIALAGQAALPCALLILGASLANVNVQSLTDDRLAVTLMCLTKLLIMPGLVLLTAQYVLQIVPQTAAVLVTLAACPSGINVLPFARGERQKRTVSAAIFVSTILSILTLPAWVYLLQLR